MTGSALVDAPAPQPLNRRSEVLSVLRQSERPLAVAEVANATGLHVNTARFHLDALVEAALAERRAEPRETPGRPRILYSSKGPSPGPRSYEFLAEMLTGFVSSLTDSGPATVELGKAWGRHLVERPAPSERLDSDEALTRLNRLLDKVGFQPETRPRADGAEVRLHHCPFQEIARNHPDIVCAIHLGLMQGALEALRAPVSATSLEPFVTPRMCLAVLDVGQPKPVPPLDQT